MSECGRTDRSVGWSADPENGFRRDSLASEAPFPERAQLVSCKGNYWAARPPDQKTITVAALGGNENIKAVVSLPPATLLAVLMWRTNCVAV